MAQQISEKAIPVATTKTVYVNAGTPYVWSGATLAQYADLKSRWDAVRNGGGPDLLVFTSGGYEYRIDLARVSAIYATA